MTTEAEALLGVVFGEATISALRLFMDERIKAHGKPADEWLTPAQVAEKLGISRRSVYRRLDSGEIPSTRWGAARRVKASDLDG